MEFAHKMQEVTYLYASGLIVSGKFVNYCTNKTLDFAFATDQCYNKS